MLTAEIVAALPRTRPELEAVISGIASMLGARVAIEYADGAETVCDHTTASARPTIRQHGRRR